MAELKVEYVFQIIVMIVLAMDGFEILIEFNCPLFARPMILLIHCMLVGHKIQTFTESLFCFIFLGDCSHVKLICAFSCGTVDGLLALSSLSKDLRLYVLIVV
jgi:hypothetical protein